LYVAVQPHFCVACKGGWVVHWVTVRTG
jgi:hypothetical protein